MVSSPRLHTNMAILWRFMSTAQMSSSLYG